MTGAGEGRDGKRGEGRDGKIMGSQIVEFKIL